MKTVLWQGVAFHSLEYFNIQENNDHYVVVSKIIGSYQKKIYSVAYQLMINKQWEVEKFLIDSEVNMTQNTLTGKKQLPTGKSIISTIQTLRVFNILISL
ncbi:putative glycolipid-binding domain-containing protein [Sphingobacterium sp. E70]|uniref:putative glycolipid-binding domain-containing protein n=1 Tax=Sphingobacterium sp. E70 TaxID=2853439 RepID=UPI00211C4B4F|nr:putative glycolipid-binding domain-containing protein [Sphingobacterium sp. E70]ULT23246.1 putative glycolipid-binding domain-containing protein [Sphingobacterium sp. E70]